MDNEDDDEVGDLTNHNDDLDEDLDEDDNNTSRGRKPSKKSKGNNDKNRKNSTSSPSSSQPQSRSISPSTYDSPSGSGAFPNLAAVAAANGIDSTTAMLAAQSLLSSNTSGLSFPNLTAAGLSLPATPSNQQGDLNLNNILNIDAAPGGLNYHLTASNLTRFTNSSIDSLIGSTRKRRTDRESLSERVKKIKPVPDDKKDEAYWERRRKNNEAAKRSRDLRRQKEDDIAIRASFLEQENLKLKAQVTILKAELSKLHFMLYNR
jgi:hypothetical protein